MECRLTAGVLRGLRSSMSMEKMEMKRMIRMRKYVGKQIFSAALGVMLLAGCLAGCGNGGAAGDGQDGAQGGGTGGQSTQLYEEGTPMGRYVEKTGEFGDGAGLSDISNRLFKLNNGQMVIADAFRPFVISKDGGQRWYTDKRAWNTRMVENGDYIMSAAVGGDNTVAVIYQAAESDAASDETADSGAAGDEAADSDAASTEAEDPESDTQGEETDNDTETNSQDEAGPLLNPQLLIIKPDKTEMPVEVDLTEEDERLKGAYISDDGRIFVTTQSANIYEILEDGTSVLFLRAEENSPDLIQVHGGMMFMDGWDYESPLIYDMEQKQYIEDEVLADFVKENYGDRNCFSGNWYDMFFFLDQEGALYIAGEKGLYRHVVGGSAMEQIIDGNLSIFSNPSYAIEGMIALENNEFMALFSGEKLVHFVYDADIPTVPVIQINVYSLEDNATMRQAINQYQTENPEIYVKYEVGTGGGNSVTREDALKSLNTKILAGEGPDVFILDDMPVDSYIEKGVLRDLSPIFDNMSGGDELFGNIVDAFRTNEGIYMMPCEVRLPVIVSRKSEIAGIKNLSDIADVVEKLRKDHPEGDLLKLYTEKGIMRMFSPVCEPVWMTEGGEVDREMIAEFLQQTKRIYDAQMDGIAERVLEAYEADWNTFAEEEFGAPWDETDTMRISMDCLRFTGGMNEAVWGYINRFWSYAEMVSVSRVQGYENSGWVPMNGQCEDVFFAKTLLGISAASKQTEAAEDFVKALFGKENQGNLYEGLPVNKAAMQAGFASEAGDGVDERWGGLATDNYEGNMISLSVYCPNQSQVAELQAYMESVKTPYMENTVLEDAVYEEGIAYMQGRKSLDEALDSVEKKMAIYLAE